MLHRLKLAGCIPARRRRIRRIYENVEVLKQMAFCDSVSGLEKSILYFI